MISIPTESKGVYMLRHSSWILASAVLLAATSPGSAQTMTPPDPGAAANVRQSQTYEQVLRSNSSFRAKRMQEECGPVTDPQLHASCVASFGDAAPPAPSTRRPH
jgi:hypothetical protein